MEGKGRKEGNRGRKSKDKNYWKQGRERRKESIGKGTVRMESGRELQGKEEQEEKDSEGERMQEFKGKVKLEKDEKERYN